MRPWILDIARAPKLEINNHVETKRARGKCYTVKRAAYLAFFFFSCLAAFFSFMVLAGFFLSLFFESKPLLISLSPSWLRLLPCALSGQRRLCLHGCPEA